MSLSPYLSISFLHLLFYLLLSPSFSFLFHPRTFPPPPTKNAAVHRSIKPQILSTIGDVALSIGIEFEVYLQLVFQILKEAAQLNITFNKVRVYDLSGIDLSGV